MSRCLVDYIVPAEPVEEGQTNMVTIVFKPQMEEKFIPASDISADCIYIRLTDELYTIFKKNFLRNITGLTLEVPSMVCWSDYIDNTTGLIQYRPLLYRNEKVYWIYIYNIKTNEEEIIKVQDCETYPDYTKVEFHQDIRYVYFLPNRKDRMYTNGTLEINYQASELKYDNCFKEEGKISLYNAEIFFSNSDSYKTDVPVRIDNKLFVNSYYVEPDSELGKPKPINNLILVRPSLIPDWVYQQLLPITDKYVYDDGTFGTTEVRGCCKLIGFNRIIKKAEYEGDTSVGIAKTYKVWTSNTSYQEVDFDSTIDLSTVPLN